MDILNIIIIVILTLIFILYFFQFKYFSKINSNRTILQKNNPDKELIEDMLDNRSPTIFTGMIENWEVKDDKNISKEEFDLNTKIFNIPLCIVKKYKQLILPKDKKTNIVKEKSNRSFLFILEGEIRLFLFSPMEEIEFEKNNISKYNIFNEPDKFKNINFLEIKLAEGHILYIPRGWSYCYRVEDYTEILNMTNESIFSLPHSILN
jgi:hypothetical protein